MTVVLEFYNIMMLFSNRIHIVAMRSGTSGLLLVAIVVGSFRIVAWGCRGRSYFKIL
jgi:hypothetical protein